MNDKLQKKFIQDQKQVGNVVLEVTTKQLYVIKKGTTSQTVGELTKEWFGQFENANHAFKDHSLVQYSNNVIEVKEM